MTSKQLSANTRFVEMDNNIDVNITRKMKTSQGISRLTLGEIGNRVSALTIDTSKGGAVKKEILQPGDGVLSRVQAAFAVIQSTVSETSSNIQKDTKPVAPHSKVVRPEADLAPVKVEWLPDHNLLPSVSCVTENDAPLYDTLAYSQAPMDISDNGMDIFSRSISNEQIEDIDAEDRDNPQLVSIYVNSIYSYMRQLEKKYSIRPNLLDSTDITGKMRAILIDWLCQVHNRFHLLQETMYLTVSIIDRYLQVKPCPRTKLQLVGVSAMLVASKYEEMYAPEVADFVYITDNAYSKKDVQDMEQDILRTLDFSFGRPLCLHFLRRFSKAGQVDAMKHTLAKYLMELEMVEYDLAHLRPSQVAAASLYLAMIVLDNSKWTPTLQFYSSYTEDELLPLVHRLAQLVVKAETNKLKLVNAEEEEDGWVRSPLSPDISNSSSLSLLAVKAKYSTTKFMKIAVIPQLKSKTLLELAAVVNIKL